MLVERFGDDLAGLPYEALGAIPEGTFDCS